MMREGLRSDNADFRLKSRLRSDKRKTKTKSVFTAIIYIMDVLHLLHRQPLKNFDYFHREVAFV